MKTVLLFGAGATRAPKPKIAIKARAPLDGDFFKIARAINAPLTDSVIQCLHSLVGDYAGSLCNSLESVASYLYIKAMDSGNGSDYHKGFMTLLDLLTHVLARTTNNISSGPKSLIYRLILGELKHSMIPENLSIITFNYDLLVERVLYSMEQRGHIGTFSFPGCYRMESLSVVHSSPKTAKFSPNIFKQSGVSVLKLHGSMNWHSAHTSNSPSPTALLNKNRKLHVLNTIPIPRNASLLVNKRRVHLKPIILPPVSGKHGVLPTSILPLWRMAGNALQEAERIVIVGYSCPPLDLEARILLSENLRRNTNKKLYAIDPNPNAAAKFLELCGVDHMTVYIGIREWLRDDRNLARRG